MLLTAIKTIGMPAAFLVTFGYAYIKTPFALFAIAILVITAAFANCISLNKKAR